jgi:hypothetical protein
MTEEQTQDGWFKSSSSPIDGCVEVRFVNGGAEVRDSKDRGGPVLKFTRKEWDAFTAGAGKGEFDLPS